MSGYIPIIEYKTNFDGDDITVKMQQMSKKAFVMLTGIPNAKAAAQYESACAILGEHIVEITGLRDTNGNAVSKEQVLDAVYFKDLVSELIAHLVQRAGLGKAKSQSSVARSPESTTAL